MLTKNKLVDPQDYVGSNGASPELSALGADDPARAEFPPLDTGVSAPDLSQDEHLHPCNEAEPVAYDLNSILLSRRGQES